LGVPALPGRKRAGAKRVKSNPFIGLASQLSLLEFGKRDEVEDTNLVKSFEGKTKAGTVAFDKQAKACEKDTGNFASWH